jgi:hypothetical protein
MGRRGDPVQVEDERCVVWGDDCGCALDLTREGDGKIRLGLRSLSTVGYGSMTSVLLSAYDAHRLGEFLLRIDGTRGLGSETLNQKDFGDGPVESHAS